MTLITKAFCIARNAGNQSGRSHINESANIMILPSNDT